MIPGRRELTRLLDDHGVRARKELGQNFVADPGVLRRIVRLAGIEAGDRVVEVGPGAGSLTCALLDAGAGVVAVEKDAGLLPVLEEVLAGRDPAPVVIRADALEVDWHSMLATAVGGAAGSWKLVANLPYNVAVPVIVRVLRTAPMIDPLVVMVQQEVAERLCAGPGGRTIGAPTVKVGWYATASVVMRVGADVFLPVPRVDSAVLRIERHEPPGSDDVAEITFRLVDTAYRQRRKMLRSSLRGVVGEDDLCAAGIEPTARPEELDVTQWARLGTRAREVAG